MFNSNQKSKVINQLSIRKPNLSPWKEENTPQVVYLSRVKLSSLTNLVNNNNE